MALPETPNSALPGIDEAIVLPGLNVTSEAFIAGRKVLCAVVE
jgi:hypothetical protein